MSQYPITLTGRLTRDPILTKTSTGAYKAKLRIASSRRIPDRQVDAGANDPEGNNPKAPQWRDVDHLYIDVEMWNQFAINVRKSLAKGMPLVIVGSLVTEQWSDDQGTDHFRTFIKAQYVGLDLNRHVIGTKRLVPQYNQENIAVPELGDNAIEPDVDHSVPQQPAERGDTAADTAADRYLAERAAAARSGEEEPYDAEAEEAAEAESATVNA